MEPRETGACVVGMPSKDTVKIVDKEQFVTKTPKRCSCVGGPDAAGFSLFNYQTGA